MLIQALQRLVATALGAEDLLLDLVDLDCQDLRLMNPFDQPAIPGRVGLVELAGHALDLGIVVEDAPAASSDFADLGAEW